MREEWDEERKNGSGKNGSVKGGMGEIREWEKDQISRMREDT